MSGPYAAYRQAIAGRPMPCAFVDLERFDRNVGAIARRAGGKTIRVATKSIRSVDLLKRVLGASPAYSGLMCYSPDEAVFLGERGFDDLLVAYPAWQADAIGRVCEAVRAGKTIVLMVDLEAHVDRLEALAAAKGVVLPVCLDLDLSMRLPGLHFGVRRSSIATPERALAIAERVLAAPHLRLDGLMGYEAQIAGVPDTPPTDRATHGILRLLKARSIRQLTARRAAVLAALASRGIALRFVNGGGTGSLESTAREAGVTEVAAGSGFFAPGLFEHYRGFRHEPAALYAIEITRQPAPGLFTCTGGGYPASGAAGENKLPAVYLPEGARLLPLEGAGEVQTPVAYRGPVALGLGDPIILRHAKAGELCERFQSLLLVAGGEVVGEVPTYRGEGRCFL